MPFIYPLERPVLDRAYVGLGIGVYDVMGAGRGVPGHLKHLGRKKALESFPSGRRSAIKGAIRFYEGQVDDARHTMMIARTAAQYGALCANSARVVGFLREDDRVVGARVRDLESGHEFDVRAKEVINAAGVWTDEIQKMVGGRGQFQVRASKGVHLVVPRNRINSATGIITRTEKSLLFIIPWGSHWIIGTTDTDWKLDLAHPAASQHRHRLPARPRQLAAAGPAHPRGRRRRLRRPATAAVRGVRLDQPSSPASTRSSSPVRGLTVIAGGKYTTYRVMAKDAVDAAVHGMQRRRSRARAPSASRCSAPTATSARGTPGS